MLKNEDLAYFAGLFDGEGSVCLVRRQCEKDATPCYMLEAGVTNTCIAPLLELKHSFGGHISENRLDLNHLGKKRCWTWRVDAKKAAKFLTFIFPYLRIKKKRTRYALMSRAFVTPNGVYFSGKKGRPVGLLEVLERMKQKIKQN